MAIKIERCNLGWRVTSPGDRVARVRVDAHNLEEVLQAVQHYYGGHGHGRDNCPLCRQIAERRR